VDMKDNYLDAMVFAREIAAFQEAVKLTLQADICGMGIIDKVSKNTVLSAPSGRNTNNLSGLIIPSGKGLAGKIQYTQEPFSLENYIDDAGITHHNTADYAVATEGIKSSVGAPMYNGRDILGVIYAWRRNSKKFSKKDLRIMAELGERISEYIENKNYLGDNEKHAIIHNIDDFYTMNYKINSYYEQILLSCLNSTKIADAVEILAAFLKHPVIVFDEFLQLRANSPKAIIEETICSENLIAFVKDIQQKDIVPITFQNPALNGMMSTIKIGSNIVGYLYVQQGIVKHIPLEQRFIQAASMIIAMYILIERQVMKVEHSFYGNILNDLLKGSLGNMKELLNQCQRSGLNLNNPHRLIILDYNGIKEQKIPQSFITNKYKDEFMCAIVDNYFVALMQDKGHNAAIQTAKSVLKDVSTKTNKKELLGLVTESCVRPEDYSQRYNEACSFLKLVESKDFNGQVISLQQLGPQRLFIHPSNLEYLRTYVLSLFGPLINYDQQKNSSLMDTLIEYFATGCNRKDTAARLYIHLHTLDYRLNRIKSISMLNFTDPQERFNIHMAVEAYKVLQLTGHIQIKKRICSKDSLSSL